MRHIILCICLNYVWHSICLSALDMNLKVRTKTCNVFPKARCFVCPAETFRKTALLRKSRVWGNSFRCELSLKCRVCNMRGNIRFFCICIFCLFRHLFLHSYAFGRNRFPNFFSSRLFFMGFNKLNASCLFPKEVYVYFGWVSFLCLLLLLFQA